MFIDIVNQLQLLKPTRLVYPTLLTALAIPDIAGAMESSDGEAKEYKYVNWFDTNVGSKYPPIQRRSTGKFHQLDGYACYQFRCAMLHQGKIQLNTNNKGRHKSNVDRIIFTLPNIHNNVFHYGICGDPSSQPNGIVMILNLDIFCQDIIDASRRWDERMTQNTYYAQNSTKCADYYAGGFKPYVVGMPVIA